MLNRAKTTFKKERKDPDFTYFDMHYHSKYSDGSRTIPQIVKRARKLGIGVAITDHNEIRGALEIANYPDVPSIPGIEVTTKEGIHILFYFYNTSDLQEFYNTIILPVKRSIYSLDISLEELLDYSRDFRTVMVAAHPYSISWMGICDSTHNKIVDKNVLSQFDAIEVINGENMHNLNMKALNLSEELKKPITGGSDGHTAHELGGVLTFVKAKVSPIEFLNQLKRSKTFVSGKESNMVSKVICQYRKIMVPAKDPIGYAQKSYTYIKKVITI